MSNSPLVEYTHLSPNCDIRKNAVYNPSGKVTKITIHHAGCVASVEGMGNGFAKKSVQSSSNYGIGRDARVAMYVEEDRRAWTSSSRDNDYLAVTIEVANSEKGGNWPVSDAVLAKLIDLCVDICQRNGIAALNYTGDKSGNLTRHNMFAKTTCPGPYLQGKFPYIAEEVNKRLRTADEAKRAEEAKKAEEVKKAEEAKKEECKVDLKMIKNGSKGAMVKALQTLLIGYGYSCGAAGADGIFGGDTTNAVKAYQAAMGLDADGIVGPLTWSKLLGAN